MKQTFKVGDKVRLTPQRVSDFGGAYDIRANPRRIYTVIKVDTTIETSKEGRCPEHAHYDYHLELVRKPIILIMRDKSK